MGNHKLRVFTSLCERVAAVASACILVLSLLIVPRVFASSEETSASSNGVDHFVTIHDQGTKYSVRTDALTVGEVLERAEISVGEHDTVEPAVEAAVSSDNFQINIYRARPVVVVDGAVSTYAYSTAYTDRHVLNRRNHNLVLQPCRSNQMVGNISSHIACNDACHSLQAIHRTACKSPCEVALALPTLHSQHL